MKKRLMCLLTLLLMLLPLAAQAGFPPDNESDWNKTVKWRTTRSTTLYSLSYRDGKTFWGPDENPADDAIFTPVGTLPSGKYINVISSEMCGKREVFYWDGGRRSAWIDADCYTRDTVSITSTTGRKTSIPRKAYGDAAAVRYILSEFLSAEEVEQFVDGMKNGGSASESTGGTSSSGSSKKTSKGTSLTLPVITLTQTAEDGAVAAVEVTMVQPGPLSSVVMLEGKEQTVPTKDLAWERGEAEHALAIVYAPRTGTATLWQKSNGKQAISKLQAGSTVLVLEKGGKYTKVLGEGQVGYVITSALTLTDPAGDGEERLTTRKMTLRLEPKAKGRSLTSIPKDTAVMVLDVQGKWAQVVCDGLTGYVEEKYLKD